MTDYKEVSTSRHESGQEQRTATVKATLFIWLLLGLLEGALGLRVLFKLIAVNPGNAFAAFVYNLTEIFVAPFATLIGSPAAQGMVLEVSSIIAMIVYLLFAWAIERIVWVIFYRDRGSVTVRQTTVADHEPAPAPVEVSKTVTTETKI
jgi:hypothetical protein